MICIAKTAGEMANHIRSHFSTLLVAGTPYSLLYSPCRWIRVNHVIIIVIHTAEEYQKGNIHSRDEYIAGDMIFKRLRTDVKSCWILFTGTVSFRGTIQITIPNWTEAPVQDDDNCPNYSPSYFRWFSEVLNSWHRLKESFLAQLTTDLARKSFD